MENHYSIALYPTEEIISLVKSMKEQLASEVGWFHSKNSVGHITICEFKASEKEITLIKNQLNRVSDTLQPIEIHLNGFGNYPNGAFFIAPDAVSKNSLKPLMKRFHDSLSIRNMQKSSDPHLSIARRLSPEKLEKATRIFTQIDERFVCDNVVLRKFDEKIKQFFVTDTFSFNNNPQTEMIQGTLF